MENTMSRRTALLSAAVSTVALAIPSAQAAEPADTEPLAINIEQLAEQFRDAAMVLDPRINECWIGYDELTDGPRDMRIMSIYFGRSDTPFVPSIKPSPTITDLFEQWRKASYDPARDGNETDVEGDARYERYAVLQDKITAMRPRSVREAAMQLVVETDDGGSEYRPEFYSQLRLIAMGI